MLYTSLVSTFCDGATRNGDAVLGDFHVSDMQAGICILCNVFHGCPGCRDDQLAAATALYSLMFALHLCAQHSVESALLCTAWQPL